MPTLPSETLSRAYLHLQTRAMIHLRACSATWPREQICDLADALHNLPQFIWPGLWSDGEFRKLYLEPYDRKWAAGPDTFKLVATLDEGLRQHL